MAVVGGLASIGAPKRQKIESASIRITTVGVNSLKKIKEQ